MTDVYRFALRPGWILSHLFVIALAVTLATLGFWQLRRLDEKQSFNRVMSARMAEPAVDLARCSGPTTRPRPLNRW